MSKPTDTQMLDWLTASYASLEAPEHPDSTTWEPDDDARVQHANALLFQSAPDLLAQRDQLVTALEIVLADTCGDVQPDNTIRVDVGALEAARSALASVKGGK